MNKIERQINLQLSGLKVREAEDGGESRVIEGHAVVFGQRSVNLTPWSDYREVYEIMEAGCITEQLIRESDIVLTAFHDNSKIMGRSVNGKGTLACGIDGKGMWVRCELAKTRDADDMLELIRRGDITGMSFCYTCDEADTESGVSYERMAEKTKDGKEVWLRHVKRCTGLYDVTIAGHPAYQGTSVSNRDMNAFIEAKINEGANEAKQREAEVADAKRRESYRIKKARLALNNE